MSTFKPGPAVALRTIPIYLYLGGWGDGPDWLYVGSRLYLTHQTNGQIHFVFGWNKPGPQNLPPSGSFFPDELPGIALVDQESVARLLARELKGGD